MEPERVVVAALTHTAGGLRGRTLDTKRRLIPSFVTSSVFSFSAQFWRAGHTASNSFKLPLAVLSLVLTFRRHNVNTSARFWFSP